MENVISIIPAINSEKLKSELEAIERIEKIATLMQKKGKNEKAKMIEHTAKYLKKLILEN